MLSGQKNKIDGDEMLFLHVFNVPVELPPLPLYQHCIYINTKAYHPFWKKIDDVARRGMIWEWNEENVNMSFKNNLVLMTEEEDEIWTVYKDVSKRINFDCIAMLKEWMRNLGLVDEEILKYSILTLNPFDYRNHEGTICPKSFAFF